MVFEGFGTVMDYIFGAGLSNINVLRILVAVIIFSVLYNSLFNVFNKNKAAAITVAIIVAIVGVRFMPQGLLLALANFIWVFVLFAVPYLLLGKVFTKLWHRVAAALAIAFALIYILRDYLSFDFGFYGFNIEVPSFLQDLYYKFTGSNLLLGLAVYWVLIFVAIIAVVLIFKVFSKKKP